MKEALGQAYQVRASVVKILLSGPLTFIPFFGCQVSGVSIQDMLLRLPFLTPETNFPEQKRGEKLSLCASSYREIFITPGKGYILIFRIRSIRLVISVTRIPYFSF